ncbi:replicase polyprotein 1a [Plakobranchus ocellatus]|uniref:Replicase polyprotein 1a n=1 Tax=Plakobranchus ocellatus TaxID=259542 RepID=A0AAV4BGT6_9GAST|nr:replicase polyprotein 1a [Plakobranchus ocellatus]
MWFKLAIILVLSIGAQADKKSDIDSCSKQEAINSAGTSSRKCTLAREWRACLVDLMTAGRLTSEEFPDKMSEAEAIHCYIKSDAKSCDIDSCSQQTEINSASRKSKRCMLARKWRACLDDLQPSCPFTSDDYPFNLAMTEAMSCYGPDDDDDDDDNDDGKT